MIGERLRALIRLVHRLIHRSAFRHSKHWKTLQHLFAYSPREQLLRSVMHYVDVTGLEGDYLEFGVYEANTFASAFRFARARNLKAMTFYAFDSFQGLPEITGVDAEGPCEFEQSQYTCDIERFKKLLVQQGVDLFRVELVPGWFGEVLNEDTKRRLPIRKAAVVYVDCDLYESTVPVLEFITDYLQPGTVIVFDDWFCHRGDPNRGQQRAMREWLEKNPTVTATEFHRFDWQGTSFIVQKQGA